MTCRICSEPAQDAHSGLCQQHFEEQRQKILAGLKPARPQHARRIVVPERVPLWVWLLLVALTLTMGVSVVGISATTGSPEPWTLTAMVFAAPTFLFWRYFMRRYPRTLWPIGFTLAAVAVIGALSNWAYVVATRPAQIAPVASPSSNPNAPAAAWYACYEAARNQFASPSGMKASPYPVSFAEKGGGIYTVRGQVEAPNAYGVMLPFVVGCDVGVNGDPGRFASWHALSVVVPR